MAPTLKLFVGYSLGPQRGSLVQAVMGSVTMGPRAARSVANAVEGVTVALPASGVIALVVATKAKMVARVFLVAHLDPNVAKVEDAVTQATIVLLSMARRDAARTAKLALPEAAIITNASILVMNPALEKISVVLLGILAIAIVPITLNAVSALQLQSQIL